MWNTTIASMRPAFTSIHPQLRRALILMPLESYSRVCFCDSLNTACRFSHISSFKEEGYYKIAKARDIVIDPCVFEMRTMRGSGPGGQGTNSSSNKVELRIDVEFLSEYFEEELIVALVANETGKALTSDGTTLIVTCHEHRSALQNKEGCLDKVREMIRQASWVPPIEADPIKRPSSTVTRHKVERRKKGNMNRMRRSARKGEW